MHFLDHILIAVITVLFPLYSWRGTRKAEREYAASGGVYNAISDYKGTIAWLTGLGALGVANWVFQSRELTLLGLGLGGSALGWAAGLALLGVGLGLTQLMAVRLGRDPESQAEMAAQLERFSFLLPRTGQDLRWFNGVCLAAGIWEEILYRGFLIWYLQHWLGSVPALVAASLAFGLAHSYQGLGNIPRTAAIGLWLGGIFILTGSLWPAMVAHFVYDAIVGRTIHGVLSGQPAPEESCNA